MSYNPYNAISAITKLKKQWSEANTAGDNTAKNKAAEAAKQYYNQLADNGYQDTASKLSASNYDAAKKISDAWAKMSKTPTRQYLYTLGAKDGLSKQDMDSAISYDSDTGEVSLGGKKIGVPDAVVDGTSYWNDASVLDNAYKDYTSRSGITAPNGVTGNSAYSQTMSRAGSHSGEQWNQINDDRSYMQGEYKALNEDAKKGVTNSDDYKNVWNNTMPAYNLEAFQKGYNTLAGLAGENEGNVDSYAAAQATNMQAALTAKGQLTANQAGIDAANATHSNRLGTLESLGNYNQGIYSAQNANIQNDMTLGNSYFDNGETAKNNDVSRKQIIAETTGQSPVEWTASSGNVFLNDDGTLKDEYKNVDFKAALNQARAAGNTELEKQLKTARAVKLFGDYAKWGAYDDGDYTVASPQKTESARQFDAQDATSRYLAGVGLAETNANNASNERIAAMDAQNKIDQINAQNGYSAAGTSTAAFSVKDYVDKINSGKTDAIVSDENGGYKVGADGADYIIKQVYGDDTLTQEQADYFLHTVLGISADQIAAAKNDGHNK